VPRKHKKPGAGGKLKIGDDWNAITIIALSQDNPLKAVAEFVENAIDAGARNVTITRGKEGGEQYLAVSDDGEGVRRNEAGVPDFRYVATHICDSIKRRLRAQGARGIQGEFGIGLLSFWTVGEQLAMSSAGADGRTYEMRMRKGDPSYAVVTRRILHAEPGTRLKIRPLLPGIRQLSGDKIQWYLAAELRERIRESGVRVQVMDRSARKQFTVEPRQFTGRLLHDLPAVSTVHGDVYVELYLNEPAPDNAVGLYRNGTRILASIAALDPFDGSPWADGYLQGIVDAPFLSITPTTRTGVVRDAAFDAFAAALEPLAERLAAIIEEQRRAEVEQVTRDTLRAIQRAFREAMLALPSEEYDYFDIAARRKAAAAGQASAGADMPLGEDGAPDGMAVDDEAPPQKSFFEYAGPLHSVRISPASCTLPVDSSRALRAIARDKSKRPVETGVVFAWRVLEGEGALEPEDGEFVTVQAPSEPCLLRVGVTATQQRDRTPRVAPSRGGAEPNEDDALAGDDRTSAPGDETPATDGSDATSCEAEALITVTDSILPASRTDPASRRGLPGYTLQHAPGKLWRSRYDAEHNVIVVNSGHRDYVYAARKRALKLRYLVRLYAKEMVRKNFPGAPVDEMLERLIELSLYAEEHLR
jgi:hypothetical protein